MIPPHADARCDYLRMRPFLLLTACLILALHAAERPPYMVLIYADDLGYGEPGVRFDLAMDPGERTPVDDAAKMAEMKARLAKLRENPGTRPGVVPVPK